MNEKIIRHTSANVDVDFYDKLIVASEIFNITEDVIFKDLIQITKQYSNIGYVHGLLSEYQDHSPDSWETLYYSLNENEIEEYGKARMKYKISTSKLAFIGFCLFWELLIFMYKERLKKSIKKDFFYSYKKFKEKYLNHIEYYIIRLNILLK